MNKKKKKWIKEYNKEKDDDMTVEDKILDRYKYWYSLHYWPAIKLGRTPGINLNKRIKKCVIKDMKKKGIDKETVEKYLKSKRYN